MILIPKKLRTIALLVTTFSPHTCRRTHSVWMGKSRAGASSGCHHDFHDNLYVLVRGKKLFHLWSPDGADAMATAGTITRIHPNGRICYRGEEHIAADGSWPEESERDGRDGDAENDHNGDEANDEDDDDDGGSALALALGPAESDDSDDDMLESALEAALDGSIPGDDYQEDCEEEEEEEVCRDDDDDDGVTEDARDGIPKSFSVLDTADDADMTTPLQDRFRKTPSVTVTLEAGDSLYLPAGWFHEVHSQDDTSGRGHVALNYWYLTPRLCVCVCVCVHVPSIGRARTCCSIVDTSVHAMRMSKF